MSNESLVQLIHKQQVLLNKAELPEAKFIHMKELLKVLSSDKDYGIVLERLENGIKIRDTLEHANVEKSVHWIRDKLALLKKSKWIKHPNVELIFEIAENLINFSTLNEKFNTSKDLCEQYQLKLTQLFSNKNYPLMGVVGRALCILEGLVEVLVEFGEIDLYSGWAEIKSFKSKMPLSFILPELPVEQINKLNLWEISEKTGYGFTHFKAEVCGNKQSYLSFEQFRLVGLILPDFVQKNFSGFAPNAIRNWKISRDTDPITLYHFLKLLSEFEYYANHLPTTRIPTSWQKYELTAVKTAMQHFFKQFLSINPDNHPLKPAEINNLAESFLNMIEILVINLRKNVSDEKANKLNADKFIKVAIKEYLEGFGDIDAKNLKSNEEMTNHLKEIALRKNDSSIKFLTNSYVSEHYRAILKSKGITRKGGAPRKKPCQKAKLAQ